MFSFLNPYERKVGLVHSSVQDLHLDELVEIIEKEPGNLIGTSPDILKRYMEIRGIGIVDVVI